MNLLQKNNENYIAAYGLNKVIENDISISDVTLSSNSIYRYGDNHNPEDFEHKLRTDHGKEVVSIGVGCMMGRYSLDREGLVYAHAANEGFTDLVAEGAYQTFQPMTMVLFPLPIRSGLKTTPPTASGSLSKPSGAKNICRRTSIS